MNTKQIKKDMKSVGETLGILAALIFSGSVITYINANVLMWLFPLMAEPQNIIGSYSFGFMFIIVEIVVIDAIYKLYRRWK